MQRENSQIHEKITKIFEVQSSVKADVWTHYDLKANKGNQVTQKTGAVIARFLCANGKFL